VGRPSFAHYAEPERTVQPRLHGTPHGHDNAMPAAHAILQMQRQAGNSAVAHMLSIQIQGSAFGMGVAVPRCTLSTPGNCSTYGDWVDQLPDYKGGGADVNLTNDPRVPADLRSLVADKIGSGLPDCADIAYVLRHYWLKAQGKSFSFKSGRSVKDSVEFTLGKEASDKEVRACMVGSGTDQFQEERKQFALVDYYTGKGGRLTDFEELRKAGLKKGDMFVWIKKAGLKGNFQGHVQTIQSIDEKNRTMTIVQGNMKDGKGVASFSRGSTRSPT
jgi:hypothetical protein